MIKYQMDFIKSFVTIFLLVVLFSCNFNGGEIPFPEKELGNVIPVTIPLQFSAEKKFTWDTSMQTTVKPVMKRLDIDALPAIPYDTSGFKAFTKPPIEVMFDFNKLPEAALNLDQLQSEPLQFKTSVLAISPGIKIQPPSLQKDKPLSIANFVKLGAGSRSEFISCVVKDKGGIMWLSSFEKLYRYDGTQVQTITIPGGPNALILGLVEDNDGRIWFIHPGGIGMIDTHAGTINYSTKIVGPVNNICKITNTKNGFIWVANAKDSSVSIINPVLGTFKKLDKKTGLSNYHAFEILEDDNQNIWISNQFAGVNIIDLSTGKIKYLKKENGLISDTITAMAKDKAGQVWIADAHGRMNAVNIKQGTIKQYDHLKNKDNFYTLHLAFDNIGRLWRGTSNGLEVIEVEKGKSRMIMEKDGVFGNIIAASTLDNNNRMWVGSNKGLNVIDQNAETVHPFLSTTNIISLMEDAVGNLWVATNNGISIINAQKNALRLLNKSNGLSNDFVQGFFEQNGKIMVTTNGGYNIIDPIAKTMISAGKKEGLVNDTIYSLLNDQKGNTWFTGPSYGISLIDSLTKKIWHADIAQGLSDNNILDIKQDNEGLIWVATFNGGINVIDLSKGTVRYLNTQPGLKDPCTKMLLADKNGRMWIGTDKGIYIADIKQGTLTSINKNNGLSNNRIVSLLEYNGSILAGTGNKINIITAPNTPATGWKINFLHKSEGLLKENNSWSSDAITKSGQYLWGDNNITIINSIEPSFDSATTYINGIDVMTQPQHFTNKRMLAEKDTLWSNDTFYVKGNLPLNSIYSVSKGITWDSVTGPFNLPVNLVIPNNDNYIHFQFVQASLGRPDTIWYSYILEGVDKKWSAPTANNITENYLNLSPGKYTFKVSSKGINGKWGTPAEFSFTIAPPWYKTWWAYTIFLLIGAGILRAYIVFRSKQLKKENRILEEKVNLRTSQLQKSIEDLKATQAQLIQSEKMASLGELTAGIAHEIQNPLNFINNFSEVNTELIAEMNEEITKGNLEEVKLLAADIASNEQKINHHGKRADGIVKGMLQHSRSGSRQKEPTNINALADEYLRLSYHGLRAKDKSFNATMKTDFDDNIGNINIVSQDIGRVILNLITNAFYAVTDKKKAAGKEYEPTVSVSTKKIGDKVEIKVSDNGNGIPQKVLDKIFQPFFTTKPAGEGTGLGLSLSYDIIKAHNGELKVETKVNQGNPDSFGTGEGSTFIITLPQ